MENMVHDNGARARWKGGWVAGCVGVDVIIDGGDSENLD